MKAIRKIIEIDEDKCDGCGQCIISCAEGALELVDGKAKLVGDILCDGIGACIGECPQGALKIVEREAEEFNEEAVGHLKKKNNPAPEKHIGLNTLACGCPSSSAMTFTPKGNADASENKQFPSRDSQLGHWPIKLQLLSPVSPFLKDSDMLLLADCAGVACPSLHDGIIKGKTIAIACPKLDDIDKHIRHLSEILANSTPNTLSVVHMEVPCCTGLVHAASKAIHLSGKIIPLKHIIISRRGEIIDEKGIQVPS